jgi:hypothetical protein
MKTLPARLLLNVMVPAVLGGAVAWSTRPVTAVPAGASATAMAGKPDSAAGASGPGKQGRPGLLTDSFLAEQLRFCDRLRTADLTQMMALLDEVQTFSDAFRRSSARGLVMEQMAQTDPTGAWALLEKWEQGSYRKQFLHAWAQVDAGGAISWAEGLGEVGTYWTNEIVAGLVPDNMAAFMKILPRLKPDQIGTEQVGTAFRLLAADDPAAAVRLLEGLGGSEKQNRGISSVGEGWARRDPKAAYAWAKELTDPAQRESALRGVFRTWAETDPQGTAARLDELKKDPAMTNAAAGESPVRAIVRAWAAQDPKAAAAWLRTRAEEAGAENGNDLSFRDLLQSEILPTRDEWNAMEVAELIRKPGEKLVTEGSDKNSPFNNGMIYGYVDDDGNITETTGRFGGDSSPLNPKGNPFQFQTSRAVRIANPAQAFDELSKQPGDASRQNVLHEIASQWAEQDPKAAMTKLHETTDPWLKLGLIDALTNLARQTNDPLLAGETAKAFTDSYRGQRIVTEIYTNLAMRDPARAQAMMNSDIDTGVKTSIASALVTQQATYDPAGAVAWATQQTDEKVQAGAMMAALKSWAGADAYGASEWLANQPGGPLREAAVRGLVQSLREYYPDEALQWAGTLSDPQQRENQQYGIVQNLIWQDPARAKDLAAGLQLSEPKRKSLDKMIQNREKNGY